MGRKARGFTLRPTIMLQNDPQIVMKRDKINENARLSTSRKRFLTGRDVKELTSDWPPPSGLPFPRFA